uniref:Uncharacterized protein n=1 Tax=Romanomermis culicivorax TaxID=13658 RepID=A0A915KDA1_ROMCU
MDEPAGNRGSAKSVFQVILKKSRSIGDDQFDGPLPLSPVTGSTKDSGTSTAKPAVLNNSLTISESPSKQAEPML